MNFFYLSQMIQHPTDGDREIASGKGFADEFPESARFGPARHLSRGGARTEDEGHIASQAQNLRSQLISRHLRHEEIGDDQIEGQWIGSDEFEGFRASRAGFDPIPLQSQHFPNEKRKAGIVVDEEEPLVATGNRLFAGFSKRFWQ